MASGTIHPDDLAAVVAVRQELHRYPEVSGAERETARRIVRALRETHPRELFDTVGGHGVVAVYGDKEGPAVLLRAELDALPIEEAVETPGRSQRPGVAHLCGHDGHAVALLLVARTLARRPVEGRRVILLFQPAEETGQGALAMLEDQRLMRLRPDMCFAWHNLPGEPLGKVIVRSGTICCGSVGMVARFAGTPAHAAYPENGSDLARVVTQWLARLPGWAEGSFESAGQMATVSYIRAGEVAFGCTPATAEVGVTLRGLSAPLLAQLRQSAADAATQLAAEAGAAVQFEWHDDFSATVNDEPAVDQVTRAAAAAGLEIEQLAQPYRWSEDFGRFGEAWPGCRSCFVGIGSGTEIAPLHNPRYRFVDELLPVAADLMLRIIGK